MQQSSSSVLKGTSPRFAYIRISPIDFAESSTLGIVTECTVRLAPKQPDKVATTSFTNVADAVRTVVELLNKGVQVTCVELLDDVTMKAINLSGQMSRRYPEVPHLFSEAPSSCCTH